MVKGIFTWVRDGIVDHDQFGQPIPINFQGEDTFKTLPGGFLSIFLTVMLLSYFLLKAKYMMTYREWSLTQQRVLTSKDELSVPLNFRDFHNITMAL